MLGFIIGTGIPIEETRYIRFPILLRCDWNIEEPVSSISQLHCDVKLTIKSQVIITGQIEHDFEYNNAVTENTGPWFNIKMTSYQYRKFHCGDKTILRPSYLHNGISNIGKKTSLYWIRALAALLAHTSWGWAVGCLLWVFWRILTMSFWHHTVFLHSCQI